MNHDIQYIKQQGKVAFVVLPIAEYQKLIHGNEDLDDIQAIEEFLASDEESLPFEVVKALAKSASPIKVLRQYRKLTQAELGQQLGVSKQYISQLEKGERTGGVRLLKKAAKVLGVSIDLLAN